jgi:hypothetical protein
MDVFIFSFPFTVSISLPFVYFTAFSFLRHRAAPIYFQIWVALQDGLWAAAGQLAHGWPVRAGWSFADRSCFRFC